MSRVRELWQGINNTQAKEVTVPFGVVEEILGEDVALVLASQVTTHTQQKSKGKGLSKTLQEMEEEKPASEAAATFNRADLVSAIAERFDEVGGLEKFESSRTTLSPLQKARQQLRQLSFVEEDNEPDDTII